MHGYRAYCAQTGPRRRGPGDARGPERLGLVPQPVEDAGAPALLGLLGAFGLVLLALALGLLDDDADLRADAAVLGLGEIRAGDAVGAVLAVGVALGAALVALTRAADARLAV